jgi:hypothetical protein
MPDTDGMKLTNFETPVLGARFSQRDVIHKPFVDTRYRVPLVLNKGGAARYSTVKQVSDRENAAGTEDSGMYRLKTSLVRSALAVTIILLACSLGVAAEQMPDAEVAMTTVRSAGLSWQVAVDYETAVLTVSGPGAVNLRREFAAGEALVFLVNDRDEAMLGDGEYTWEIRFAPALDAEAKKALRAARESGDTVEIEALRANGDLPAGPHVISGYFRVKAGLIIDEATEASYRRSGGRVEATGSTGAVDFDSTVPAKDQLILDDLIVDGSLCVGFDCVNGESFGFDTIRLKENNLRIRAVDTSNTASFPTNDWQITFNDSSNGGANKFSIDDIDGNRTPFTIEASAPSHSLYVDDGGRIGFGTSTPVVHLHVKDGNTPTLRLEQDGSSGFTAQTWDVAGNEANFFIRDATNGSTLPFRIRPSAPSDSLFVDADGDIGLGTSSPDSTLDLEANGPGFRLTNTGGTGSIWDFRVDPTSGRLTITDDPTSARNPIKIGFNANNNLLKIGTNANDRVDIKGKLFINGVDNSTPDFVFEADFDLESIDEHAEAMWRNKHLPALAPAQIGEDGKASIDVANRSQGVLKELEIAHIYIQQLHERITQLENRLEELAASAD